MKKTLIITSSEGKDDLLETLIMHGLKDEKLLVFHVRKIPVIHVMGVLRSERPEVVILDGDLPPMILKDMNTAVGDSMFKYDFPCSVYSVLKETGIPGVIHIDDCSKIQSIREDNKVSF
jgi:hypothetical protein